ncbi:MAG TPA: hypothetical protein VF432_16280 [Thermoanaerobaculia bacterium]
MTGQTYPCWKNDGEDLTAAVRAVAGRLLDDVPNLNAKVDTPNGNVSTEPAAPTNREKAKIIVECNGGHANVFEIEAGQASGRPPTPDETIWIAARNGIDPQASLDRVTETAKFLYGSVGIFATLLSGLGMVSQVTVSASPEWWMWLPLFFVTISLTAATIALTPTYSSVRVNDLDAVAEDFRCRIQRGGWLIKTAGLTFALAILTTFPVALVLIKP